MSKVVFRVGKLKTWGQVGAAAGHNLRTRPTPSADPAKPPIVIKPITDPLGAIGAVVATIGTQTIRKNAVLAAEVIISASPEYFRPSAPEKAGTWEQSRLDAWREKVEPWIAQEFPHAVSVVLHLDESTPHYQIIDVPLDEGGKLNCRGKYGGADTLRQWQDRAAEPVASLGIERGIAGSLAKHERVKAFYGAANAPVPALPPVKTKAPAPLPEPTMAERIPFTDAKAERERLEAEHAALQAQRNREIGKRNAEAARMHPQIAQKANFTDLAQRKQRDAEATAEKLARASAEHKAQADKIRALPLPDVLARVYGAEEAPDSKPSHKSRKFNLPDGRQVAVTDDKWIEQGGKGGKGAINLAMHLDGLEFKPAVRLLADHFDAQALAAEHARQLVTKAAQEVEAIQKEPTPVPAAVPGRWPKVKHWLEEVRGVPAKLVDWLHEKGLVFADARANAVFPRARGGAFVRGTGETPFKRTFGTAAEGTYKLPGTSNSLYLVEGPADALAIKSMHPEAIVMATGGNLIPPGRLRLREGLKIFAAFDDDTQGRRLAAEAAETLGAERYAPPGRFKDWSECVKNEPWRVSKGWRDGGEGQGQENAPEALKTPRPSGPRM